MHPIPRIRLFLLLLILWPALLAAEPGDQLWMFQGIEDIHAMGHLPDVDGDGVPDVLVETYDAGADGDHLNLLSGGDSGTPGVIWSTRPESGVSNGGGYGDNCLSTCEDLNGDGFPDVLLGTAWGNRSVHAVDGITGEVIWTFDTYDETDSGWVYSVVPHPDRTGDGVPEVAFGAGSDNNMGYLLDGSDGSVIWRFNGSWDAIGLVLSLPDVNGDEVPDVLFCGWDDEDRVFCVSGAGGPVAAQIWSRDTGGSTHGAALLDDIDGDEIADLAVGSWTNSNQVICLSGATGFPLWDFDNGGYNYIMRLTSISDVNGDGYRDLAVGSWDNAMRVVSGETGDLIWESYAGTTNGGDFWAVERVDDVTGDGLDEVVGGSFDHKVYLFDGADGDTLWMYNTARRLYSVRGAPDLSGNGVPDVLAGTQFLDWGGRAFAIEGGEELTATPPFWTMDGLAEIVWSGTPRVDLSWTCNEALPFNIYRCEGAGERSVASKLALALAGQRGEMTDREILAARHREEASQGELVNPRPVEPGSVVDGNWRYGFTDEPDQTPLSNDLRYRLHAVMPDGQELFLGEIQARPSQASPPAILAAGLYPNPFNPTLKIRFELARPARVACEVHDSAGRLVLRRPTVEYSAGRHEIQWTAQIEPGTDLPSGVYHVTLRAGSQRLTLRAVLIK